MKNFYSLLSAIICLSILFACNSSNETENDSENSNESEVRDETTIDDEKIVEEEAVPIETVEELTETAIESTKKEVVSAKMSSISEQRELLIGTWIFTKATAGGTDSSSKYFWGYFDGKMKKMTLLADGRIEYEKDFVDALKIINTTWKIEKHATDDVYYFVTQRTAEGATEMSREKIMTLTAKKFVFGKKLKVEYAKSQ